MIWSNHKNAHYTQLRNMQQHHVYHARSADLDQGKKRCWQFAMISDEPVELQELSLHLHTSFLENKPSLSLLFILYIENSSWRQQLKAYEPKTGEQSIFSEIHIMHTFEMP